MTLREKIGSEILASGPIPFSRYMELCLYDPEFGYYARLKEQFGRAGDFYTSSDVHAVFGRLLARQFEEMWRALDCPNLIHLVELGPGRGLFARDVLDWSEQKFPEFFRALHYVLAEKSGSLRSRLQTTLEHHIMRSKAEIAAGEDPQLDSGAVIVFGNEFFDAFPVEIVSLDGMLHVGRSDGKLVELFLPVAPLVDDYLDKYSVRPEPGERIEAGLAADKAMQALANRISRGFFVFIDYGYTREEQLVGRHRDTLMAYRRHSASANPYEAPGEQDITAHVNFTALAGAAAGHAMRVERLLTQSQFLMGIGESNQFADAFEGCRIPQEQAKVAMQLKHLVTPGGMGETFQVMIASKNVSSAAIEKLSGLKFLHSLSHR